VSTSRRHISLRQRRRSAITRHAPTTWCSPRHDADSGQAQRPHQHQATPTASRTQPAPADMHQSKESADGSPTDPYCPTSSSDYRPQPTPQSAQQACQSSDTPGPFPPLPSLPGALSPAMLTPGSGTTHQGSVTCQKTNRTPHAGSGLLTSSPLSLRPGRVPPPGVGGCGCQTGVLGYVVAFG